MTIPLLLVLMFVSADATDRDAIIAVAESFSKAYVAGDVDAMMDCYTDDAVIMPNGTDIIGDRAVIRRYWTSPPGMKVLSHRTWSERLIIRDGTAYDWGYYEGTTSRDGKESSFSGKYLIVWEKGKDGKWRMKADMWNSRARRESK